MTVTTSYSKLDPTFDTDRIDQILKSLKSQSPIEQERHLRILSDSLHSSREREKHNPAWSEAEKAYRKSLKPFVIGYQKIMPENIILKVFDWDYQTST